MTRQVHLIRAAEAAPVRDHSNDRRTTRLGRTTAPGRMSPVRSTLPVLEVLNSGVSPRKEEGLVVVVTPSHEVGRLTIGTMNLEYQAITVRLTGTMPSYDYAVTNARLHPHSLLFPSHLPRGRRLRLGPKVISGSMA